MKQHFLLTLIALLTGIVALPAQELRCTVTVNADKIDGSNKSMFQTLQQSISEMVNSTRWTDMVFAETERIECTMLFIINSVTTEGMVNASLQVQSRRPVYGTSYMTPLLNLMDEDIRFTYQEYDRLDYQPTQFTTNLVAIVTYYCYLIIGLDADSYSRLGGTPFFQQCENIVANAQTGASNSDEQGGWKSFGSTRNRHILINNLMDDAFTPFRNYFYDYHRLGLDLMSTNVTNGRKKITDGMTVLKDMRSARPAGMLVPVFLDAKNDELVNILQKATDSEKKAFLELMETIDPTRLTQYEKINQ